MCFAEANPYSYCAVPLVIWAVGGELVCLFLILNLMPKLYYIANINIKQQQQQQQKDILLSRRCWVTIYYNN
jgi:hypothetical protein